MKILLAACNAKYIHSNLAVYSLKAYAGKYEKNLLLREYTINQQKDDILRDIFKSDAQVVCFSCYIWNISFVRELLADLAQIMPDTDFWVGGPEVSYEAVQFLSENPQVKGVMLGEGEETFLDLVRYYVEGTPPELSNIRGIAWRERDRVLETGWREPMDLSLLPFVYQDLQAFENRILYYETSRGCPFSCSYCLSSVEKKLRFRSLDLVLPELQFFLDHRVPQVKFVDRTFNCRHSHALAIWRYLTEHDNGITNFHFEISADLLTEEEMALMAEMRPGLIQLGFLKVLKGSRMMDMASEYGIVYKKSEPYEVLFTRWLSYEEILKLKMVESMVEIYYNSGQFRSSLPFLLTYFPGAFSFYEALGAYYEKKGYQEISHSRIRRYEILLEFCQEYPEIPKNALEDHLICDLYIREHYKSRPPFGRDQKPFERQLWLYRKKNQVAKTAHVQILWDGRAVLFDYEKRDPLSQNAVATEIDLSYVSEMHIL